MITKKILTTVLVLLFWAITLQNLAAEEQVIKIGVIVPLTGDNALHGTEIQQSMKLALDFNAAKAKKYQYKLIFEDNQLDGAKSVSAAQKLVSVDKVDVIVTLWPPTASVVIPLTEKAGILHYTISWDPDLARTHQFVLSHQVMVDDIVRATLAQLQKDNKHKIAFFHAEETGFNLGARYVRELSSGYKIELVADEAFNPKETDFRSLINKVHAKKPDAYLIWSAAPSIDILIKQIRSRDKNVSITGYLDLATDLKQIENLPYVSEIFATDGFAEEYRKTYKQEIHSKGANAYDIMNLIIEAFENSAGTRPTAKELKTYLVKIREYPGAVGAFSIDQSGNSTYSPVVREVKNGKKELKSITR